MLTGIEYVRMLCKENKIAISALEKECGFSNGYLNPKKAASVSYQRAVQIHDFFSKRGIHSNLEQILSGKTQPSGIISLFSGPKAVEEGLHRYHEEKFRKDMEQILDEILSEQQKEAFNKKINERLSEDPTYQQTTLAAHFDGNEFTEDELDEIRQFAEFVKNRKTK